jgi:hypothetical protein
VGCGGRRAVAGHAPPDGLDVTGGSTVLVQGVLAGITQAWRQDGNSFNSIRFSGTTLTNNNGTWTWQAPSTS